jgi:SAM-dependent methyltransferase
MIDIRTHVRTEEALPACHDVDVLFEDRHRAESFGADAALYHRVRPRYPVALIDHLVGDGTPAVLDVGCGTGIASGLLAERGCAVLGVEPDARMAAVAREQGITVEVSPFEEWDPRGRTFDLVTCAQAWHWVAPRRGVERAARVLGPGGRIALFWNLGEPTGPVAAELRAVYERLAPEFQNERHTERWIRADRELREADGFGEPAMHEWSWERAYTTGEWLGHLMSHSDHRVLDEERRSVLLAELARVIDDRGGTVTVAYDTRLVEAVAV